MGEGGRLTLAERLRRVADRLFDWGTHPVGKPRTRKYFMAHTLIEDAIKEESVVVTEEEWSWISEVLDEEASSLSGNRHCPGLVGPDDEKKIETLRRVRDLMQGASAIVVVPHRSWWK